MDILAGSGLPLPKVTVISVLPVHMMHTANCVQIVNIL